MKIEILDEEFRMKSDAWERRIREDFLEEGKFREEVLEVIQFMVSGRVG